MKRLPPELRTVYDCLSEALSEVFRGNLDARQGAAMAALSRAMVGVLDTATTLEGQDTEDRCDR